jgi:hypothetical protein
MMVDEGERRRVNAFDWKSTFPQAFAQGGFDVVIGNPPYIRIQTLQETTPINVGFYKEYFKAASKGNYDIYVIFVEKGLSLLNGKGRLGFILPNKFFNAQYGEPLRELIARGKHLAKVVHFGDQQVFERATTYTSLMFLDKAENNEFEFEKVTDLDGWRAQTSGASTIGKINAGRVTVSEWNFAVGEAAGLLERLASMPVKLNDVAERVFQGLVTGADPVFILRNAGHGKYLSDATKKAYAVERQLMHSLCKGSVNIRRYGISELEKSILFPYRLIGGKAVLLSPKELQTEYPIAWEYLRENRSLLEARERGKWKHDKWYAFGRSQNLSEMEQMKLLTPSIASRASFTFDSTDFYYFIGSGGGGGGGYGITLKPGSPMRYEYLLGLLNSKLLDAYLKTLSSPFSGGYYAYNRQYIEQLPIHAINFSDPAEKAAHDKMVSLVDRMLALHKQSPRTPQEKEGLAREIEATDGQIDRLVYELYGLTEEEVRVVEGK